MADIDCLWPIWSSVWPISLWPIWFVADIDVIRSQVGTSKGHRDHSFCIICSTVPDGRDVIQCKTCHATYHPALANIDDDVFHVLKTILPVVGWVCPDCIAVITDQRKLDKQFENLNSMICKLEQDHQELASKVQPIIATNKSVKVHPAVSVQNTIQLRCKRNVLISGLNGSTGVPDTELVSELCERKLNYKPWFDNNSCKHIGKSNPPLLRITLAT